MECRALISSKPPQTKNISPDMFLKYLNIDGMDDFKTRYQKMKN